MRREPSPPAAFTACSPTTKIAIALRPTRPVFWSESKGGKRHGLVRVSPMWAAERVSLVRADESRARLAAAFTASGIPPGIWQAIDQVLDMGTLKVACPL